MSELDILLNTVRSFDGIMDGLRELFNTTVSEVPNDDGRRAELRVLDVVVFAYDHADFEDDAGMPLSKYEVVVGIEETSSGRGVQGYASLVWFIAQYVAARLSLILHCEARLVRNLQTSLAVFEKGILVEGDTALQLP